MEGGGYTGSWSVLRWHLTLSVLDIENCSLHKNGVEFHQKLNGWYSVVFKAILVFSLAQAEQLLTKGKQIIVMTLSMNR